MKTFLKEIQLNETIILNYDESDEISKAVFKRLFTLHETFQKHGIDDTIFKASIGDLENRFLKNLKSKGFLTLEEKDMKWINMILDFKIFKLGSLRFQVFPMDYQEIERESFDEMLLNQKTKEIFYETRPLINMHIEKDTELSPKAVDDALTKARAFFTNVFSDIKFDGFVCRTWLIHPGVVSLLNPNSNIARFAGRFEIIAENKATYQALARVYQTEDLNRIKDLPKVSSMEKTIYKNIEKLGVAFGFIPF